MVGHFTDEIIGDGSHPLMSEHYPNDYQITAAGHDNHPAEEDAPQYLAPHRQDKVHFHAVQGLHEKVHSLWEQGYCLQFYVYIQLRGWELAIQFPLILIGMQSLNWTEQQPQRSFA